VSSDKGKVLPFVSKGTKLKFVSKLEELIKDSDEVAGVAVAVVTKNSEVAHGVIINESTEEFDLPALIMALDVVKTRIIMSMEYGLE